MTKTLGTAYIDIEPRIGSFLAPQAFVELPLANDYNDNATASVNIAAIAVLDVDEPGASVLLSSGVAIRTTMQRLVVLERMAEIHAEADR